MPRLARGRLRGVGAHGARGRRRVRGRGRGHVVRAQRGRAREAAHRPPDPPRRVDQRERVHDVRGRRRDRRDADRHHRVLVLGGRARSRRPTLRCLVLTPVSPHMLFDRSLVLAEHEELGFVVCDDRGVVLTLDGRELGELARGDRVRVPRRARAAAARERAPARLPPDPEGEVRPPGSVRPMLSSCASRTSASSPSCWCTLGAGLTVITGETGAGKTLARRRARPPVRRPRRSAAGARRARPRRASRAASSTATTRSCSRASFPRTAARAATSTASSRPSAELAERGRRARRSARPARAPVAARAGRAARAARPLRGAPGRDARAAASAPRAPTARRIADELAAIGGDERSRAREVDLLRYELAEIDAAAIADPDEDDRARDGGGAPRRRRGAPRGARRPRTRRSKARREDALGAAVAALVGPRAVRGDSPTGCARSRSKPRRSAHDVRARPRSDRRRPGAARRRCSSGARGSRELRAQVRPDARRRRRRTRSRRAPASTSSRSTTSAPRPGSTPSAAAATRRGRSAPPRAVEGAARGRGPLAGRGRPAHLRELAMPAATFAVDVEPGDPRRRGDDGADDVTFLLAPNPGEPARPLARGRFGRRAVARDAGPARRALGGAADPRVRRGRRRDRRRGRHRGRARARDAWAVSTRCCA